MEPFSSSSSFHSSIATSDSSSPFSSITLYLSRWLAYA